MPAVLIGSSPRVWGTLLMSGRSGWVGRFIPACVGNSVQIPAVPNQIPVHPRVCGELWARHGGRRRICGSSPRVWGTLLYPPFVPVYFRFIPACVGNSFSGIGTNGEAPVHPRVCGELNPPRRLSFLFHGSSPRVWGTLFQPSVGSHLIRFIPTCVGNSRPSCRAQRPLPVHPRVCGELNPPRRLSFLFHGSSPRVWGTRLYVPL